jgi:hypothetical protein
MTTIWQELGIDPTTDSAVIKSAYAARLKVTRPDENPDGFQRLRAAYNAALRQAGQRELSTVSTFQSVIDREEIKPERAPDYPPKPGVAEVLHEREETVRSLRQVFSNRKGEAAIAAIEHAIARQVLPIDIEHQFVGALIGILYNDRAMPARRLLEIAQRFGWYDVPDRLRGHNGPAERRLCARIDAELWLEEIRHHARSWKYWIGQREPAAARLLLGTGPTSLTWIAAPEPPLSRRLAEGLLHAPQLDNAIDTDRLTEIQRIVVMRRKRQFQAATVFFNVALMFVLAVLGLYFIPQAAMGVIILSFGWYRYAGAIRGTYRTGLIFPLAATLWVALAILYAELVPSPPEITG